MDPNIASLWRSRPIGTSRRGPRARKAAGFLLAGQRTRVARRGNNYYSEDCGDGVRCASLSVDETGARADRVVRLVRIAGAAIARGGLCDVGEFGCGTARDKASTRHAGVARSLEATTKELDRAAVECDPSAFARLS